MPTHTRKLLVGGTVILLAALLAGLAVVVAPFMPFQNRWAQQRWQQHGLRHYELEISWANGWNYGEAHVEMRDGQIIQALDPVTGRPLDPQKLVSARYFGSVDNLFEIIEKYVQPEWNWRNLLAHYAPPLANQLVPCVAPLPKVSYDAQFGFPAELWYNDTWCANTFFNYSHVAIRHFRPLP